MNRDKLITIIDCLNHVCEFSPPIEYEGIEYDDLLKQVKDDCKHLSQDDIVPDDIVDLMDSLGIKHPLLKIKDRSKFDLDFVEKNKPSRQKKKEISREESVTLSLRNSWQTLDDLAHTSNKLYAEKGGKDNIEQAEKAVKVGLRYLIPSGLVEIRGYRNNAEFRINESLWGLININMKEDEDD